MRAATIALLVLAGCGGPDQQFVDLYPVFSSAPKTLDLGEVGPPLSGTASLTITNAGRKALEVTGALEGGEGIFALEGGAVDLVIAPDESADVTVTFTPATFRAYSAALVLETTDEERPRVRIPVTGTGVDLPFPDVAIAPSQTIELPEVPAGETDFFVFEVVNEGDADLEVTGMTLDGPGEFVGLRLEPTVVVPGERTTAIVEYRPEPGDEDGATATVTVATNDPDEPETTVLLIGNGGGAFEYPVAAIDCPASVLLTGPETVTLSGAESYDPAGFEPLAYQWFVAQRPPASDASIPIDPDDAVEADLRVDVAGTWQVVLFVENAIGTQGIPAICEFEAIPEDDLHIELSWNTPASDLDLHLNLAGNTLFDEPGVCNWCNQNADWGVAGSDDDPRLDIDDRGGLGPENINVLRPADGGYDVVVHHYEDNGDGPATATVKLWLDGVLVFDDAQVVEEDQIWRVGQVSWSSTPTFTPDGAVAPVGPRRSCY
jgi:hypothetical protein